jgi:phosphoribosyl-dephospho-CoA transferase
LVLISRHSWRAMLASSGDLATDPLLVHWLDNGWPLVARRPIPGETLGVPVALSLPPWARRRRLAFLVQREQIVSISPPPTLAAASLCAPHSWWPSLDRLEALGARHAVEIRVCGSLAWHSITGLDYVTANSDLDLLVQVRADTDVLGVAAALDAIQMQAPMRLDGELIRNDGAAVSWRELHAGVPEILLKSLAGVALIERHRFIQGEQPC